MALTAHAHAKQRLGHSEHGEDGVGGAAGNRGRHEDADCGQERGAGVEGSVGGV